MKKTILTILIFLSFTGVAYAARKTIYIKGGRTTTYQTPSNYGTLGGPGEATSTSGLVGYWPFSGKYITWSSSTVGTSTDASGNNHNGTLVGMNIATSTVEGKTGQALKFSSINSYVSIPASSSFYGSSSLSFSMWVNPALSASSCTLLEAFTTVSPHVAFVLDIHTANNYFFVELASSTGVLTPQISTITGLYVNKWYFLTVTYNGSNASIFLNGVFQNQSAMTGTIYNFNTLNIDTTNAGFAGCVGANINEVRLYNRALSATEVQQLYQLGLTTIIK